MTKTKQKQPESYLKRQEVVVQLAGLIAATDYARCPPYQCLNCLPCYGETRAASHEEYFGVAKAVKGLGLNLEEVNDEHNGRIFALAPGIEGFFDECISPDDLCETVARVMVKKGLLKLTEPTNVKKAKVKQK